MLGTDIELMPGEQMILASNPHWFYFWKQVAAGAGVIGLLLLVSLVNNEWLNSVIWWILIGAFVVLLINLGYNLVQWKTTKFAITDQRVAYQSGVIRRRGVSIPLNRVNNVNFNQSMIARALNNGTVTIESAGQTGDSVFENIPDPEHVRSVIFAQVEADEQRDSDRDAASLAKAMREHSDGTPTSTPAPPSATDRLAALDELKMLGHIDATEYATKRQQILDEL